MNPIDAAFASWNIPPWATFFLLLTAVIYYRGWRQIRRTRRELFSVWRLFCFLAGMLTLWIAIASPFEALSGMLLVAHMTQHLLLMTVAPPLVALSAPMVPLLRGLPRFFVREGLGPFFTLAPVHAVQRLLKSRLFAWIAMNFAFLAWHVPAAYDLALAHPGLHEAEHLCFFLTSVLFWWPILQPWPVVYKGSRWLLLPYLLSADIINTSLSAFLSFSGRVVYPTYADAPRLFGVSALSDQVAAGSLMWVLGSTFFVVPAIWITLSQLSRRDERRTASRFAQSRALREQAELARMYALEVAPAYTVEAAGNGRFAHTDRTVPFRNADRSVLVGHPEPGEGSAFVYEPATREASPHVAKRTAGFDLFTLPAVGAFFKSRHGRQSLQAVLLLAAAAIIVDGLFGHQMSSMNLAGIVPWTYARALFVLALLLVGNLFCMSCPFMLPRELAKRLAERLGFARLPWPRALRGKWLSAALLGLFFWAYEAFALWDSPMRTASLLLAYFLTAFLLDSIFRGASFCKYVCPLGQFNFVSSLLSPVELKARSQAVCTGCSTRDCISGNETQRGCELDLFMPQKSGNLDCTLCMDCVKACPHDNIGLFVQPPARELVQIAAWDPQRSSVGHYSQRADVATLALVLVSAGFASAAVMVVPVASLLTRASAHLPPWLAPSAGLLLAAAAPGVLFLLLVSAVLLTRRRLLPDLILDGLSDRHGAGDLSLSAQLSRWTLALLPLGLGMWAAHLSFHLVTAAGSLGPALQQAAFDLHLGGRLAQGASPPTWMAVHSLLAPESLLALQMALLDAGLLFALYLGWRMVRSTPVNQLDRGSVVKPARPVLQDASSAVRVAMPSIGSSLATLAPWACVVLLLYAAGVWVLLEPMQMRGMMGM